MANHSKLPLKKAIKPGDVEKAVAEINRRRFDGRLELTSPESLTKAWRAARAWYIEAPDTRPEKPGPCNPDENLGFCFWLNSNRKSLEFRHDVGTLLNSWIYWVMSIFEHELAQHFGLKEFNCDGKVAVNPAQFKANLYDYASRNFEQPLCEADEKFIYERFTSHIPKGWE